MVDSPKVSSLGDLKILKKGQMKMSCPSRVEGWGVGVVRNHTSLSSDLLVLVAVNSYAAIEVHSPASTHSEVWGSDIVLFLLCCQF